MKISIEMDTSDLNEHDKKFIESLCQWVALPISATATPATTEVDTTPEVDTTSEVDDSQAKESEPDVRESLKKVHNRTMRLHGGDVTKSIMESLGFEVSSTSGRALKHVPDEKIPALVKAFENYQPGPDTTDDTTDDITNQTSIFDDIDLMGDDTTDEETAVDVKAFVSRIRDLAGRGPEVKSALKDMMTQNKFDMLKDVEDSDPNNEMLKALYSQINATYPVEVSNEF